MIVPEGLCLVGDCGLKRTGLRQKWKIISCDVKLLQVIVVSAVRGSLLSEEFPAKIKT